MNSKLLLVVATLIPFGIAAVTPRPVGLVNVGNSCFINASIQALYAMDDLNKLVMRESALYRQNSISSLYTAFLVQALHSSQTSHNLSELSKKGWQMLDAVQGTQQTADEFLTALLHHLSHADLTERARADFSSYRGTNVALSRIAQLFYTLTGSYKQDGNGRQTEPKISAHSSLNLPIKAGDFSLYNCMQTFFANGDQETIKIDGKWTIVERKHSLIETQPYLIISLKRNQPVLDLETNRPVINPYTGEIGTVKRPEAISFPLRRFDLKNFYHDKSKKRETYDLIAVIMHSGEDNAGHYVSYIKKSGLWYLCSDERITKISEDSMNHISQRGYGETSRMTPTLFIYERTGSAEIKELFGQEQRHADATIQKLHNAERQQNITSSEKRRQGAVQTSSLQEPIIPEELLADVIPGFHQSRTQLLPTPTQRPQIDDSAVIPTPLLPSVRPQRASEQTAALVIPNAAAVQLVAAPKLTAVRRNATKRPIARRQSQRRNLQTSTKRTPRVGKAILMHGQRTNLARNRTRPSVRVQKKATVLITRKKATRRTAVQKK